MKRRSIYWNPEKHPDFDAWVTAQENLSRSIRELVAARRIGSREDSFANLAQEVAPLVAAIIGPPREGAAPSLFTPAEPIGRSRQEREELPPVDIPAGGTGKTRANARKIAERFRMPDN